MIDLAVYTCVYAIVMVGLFIHCAITTDQRVYSIVMACLTAPILAFALQFLNKHVW